MCHENENTTRQQATNKKLLDHVPIIDSGHLFAGHKEVQIQHAGEVYRLRVTRNGKLILNK